MAVPATITGEMPRAHWSNTTLAQALNRFLDRDVPALLLELYMLPEEHKKIMKDAIERASENAGMLAELARQQVNIKAMAAVEAAMDRSIALGLAQMDAVAEYRERMKTDPDAVKAIIRQSHRAQDMMIKSLEIMAGMMKVGGNDGKGPSRGSAVTVNVAGISGNSANPANALLLDAVSGARRVRKDHDSRQAKSAVDPVVVQLGSGADSPGDDRSGV